MSGTEYLKVRAPAKLILSGEHSVVYGHPALAMAINNYNETFVRWSTPFHFTFNLLGIDFKQKVTLEALKRLKRKLKKQYQQFESGQIHIHDVLKHPFELTLYTAINVIDKVKHHLPMGIDIDTHSNIPIGCGLGSSAACVVSLITALSQFLDIDMSLDDYVRLGIESENLQHGFSSGLDIHMSLRGGCTFYQAGQFSQRPIPDLPMVLVQTGQPLSSTGECVLQVKSIFKNSSIGNDFARTTMALDQAMRDNSLAQIKYHIRQNHQLLKSIGVVPQKVADFITSIENLGGAAKICGAGSVKGDSAGVVLVICEDNIIHLAQQHGYQIMLIKGDAHGATVV